MEFIIKTQTDSEGIFAQILTEKGDCVAIGEGEDSYKAIKEACLVFVDIVDNFKK